MGTQRGNTSATAVLEAPEETYAPATGRAWREPAPAGALQRGYPSELPGNYDQDRDEDEYRPRRGTGGGFRPSLRGLLRSSGGRIVLGTVMLLLLGAVATGLFAARYYLLRDPRFVVAGSDSIQISGNQHLTREQILNVFGGDLERNIFRVNLAERRADLERLPWVEHATVMRLLPNQLRVQIKERTPAAFARQGTQIGLVDANGVLLDMPVADGTGAAMVHYSFPVLTGIVAGDPLSTRAARMAVYQQFMQALDGTGKGYSKQVSEVDVSDPEDVKALMVTGGSPVLVHFGDDQFLARYQEFAQHLPEWKQQYPKLAAADMRYDGQIVLEMQPGAAAPPAPTDSAAPAVADADKPAAQPESPKTSPAKAKAKAKTAALKKVVGKPAKPVAKPAVAHDAKGKSKANEKLNAALAAKHKAALAKAKPAVNP